VSNREQQERDEIFVYFNFNLTHPQSELPT